MSHLSGSLGTLQNLNIQLEVADIQIGAVEIKDRDSTLRVDVATFAGLNRLLVEAVIAAGGLPHPPNFSAIEFETVTIAVAGTPVQGPSIAIPDGATLLVTMRITQAGVPQGFIGKSAAEVIVATTRHELLKGGSLSFLIDNMDLLFFDSDTNGTILELSAEQ